MQHADFLIEIHTEELPPKSLHALAIYFCDGIKTRLQKAELSFNEAQYFATPRRLAVLITQLASQQSDKLVERKGPALDKAYDSQQAQVYVGSDQKGSPPGQAHADSKPTQACVGFARSCGIDVSELIIIETPQGKFVGCKQQVTGKTVFQLMPNIIEETLTALPIPKPMRWGNHSQKFIRPVHSVMMLYGDKIIDANLLGCKTGNKTRGHRFHHPDWIKISSPDQYASTLKKAFVIADFSERKEKIRQATLSLAKEMHATAVIDLSLLDEVTSLVEWPAAICGSFDKEFLTVPQEALISAMQDHQRYFPLVDQHNKLLPHFVTISNIESKDHKRVIAGNERVLRARLSDAAFFFTTDKKIRLEDRIEKLSHIVFQHKLGTLLDKTERLKKSSLFIAKQTGENTALADRAALLSKTDLMTDLVVEFPELQGIAGYYYALHDGESDAVAKALNEQYMPRFSGDQLPETQLGCVLALADRIDTLVGVFGINQAPTADKDPFGLRRAALGILRILIEKPFNLDLYEMLSVAAESYTIKLENPNTVRDTFHFILDRLKPWYQEQNITSHVIASVMALNLTKPYDIHRRIQAVMAFKNCPEAEALSSANKRVSNILAKYDGEIASKQIDSQLFESDAERDLANKLREQERMISELSQSAQYQAMLTQLASLRVPVDNFFDHVMVMTDDKERRENRLLMLKKLRELFLHVADIALLQ